MAGIHAEHLNTPRVVADQNQAAVWSRPPQEPFVDSPPDENPSGLGVFENPLRESNYYADKETGDLYAMYRDAYSPPIGRFDQFDPIGLRGGVNGFAFVDNNPISNTDLLGLMGFGGGVRGNTGYSRFQPSPGNPYRGFNWCGPGNRAGPPLNCVDSACKKHNDCYSQCFVRAATRWFPNTLSRCAAQCDVDLINEYFSCKASGNCPAFSDPAPLIPPLF